MVRVKHNPLSQTVRKALDSVSFAMLAHGIWTSEFQHPEGGKGVEYVMGLGRDGQVVATWDVDTKCKTEFKWVGSPTLTTVQTGLIEAHSSIFATL